MALSDLSLHCARLASAESGKGRPVVVEPGALPLTAKRRGQMERGGGELTLGAGRRRGTVTTQKGLAVKISYTLLLMLVIQFSSVILLFIHLIYHQQCFSKICFPS